MKANALNTLLRLTLCMFVGWSSFFATATATANIKNSLEPIIPLQQKDLKLENWELILVDSDLEVKIESDQQAIAAEATLTKTAQLLKTNATMAPAARAKILYKQYRLLASLNSYLLDVVFGHQKSNVYQKKAPILLSKTRKELFLATNDYLKLQKQLSSPQQQSASILRNSALARHHSLTTSYLAGKLDVVSAMLSNAEHLNAALSLQVYTLAGYHGLLKFDQQDIQKLIAASKNLDREGRAAASLVLARHYAAKQNQLYRRFLSEGLELSNRASREQQMHNLDFAITIWRQAEPKGSWASPPIPATMFRDTDAMRGVRERAILTVLAQGKVNEALDSYRMLSPELSGSRYMSAIDDRIIAIEEAIYNKKKVLSTYEGEIRRLISKYDNDALIKTQPKLYSEALTGYKQRYYRLTFATLDAVESTQSSHASINQAIALGFRFIKWTNDYAAQVKAKEQIARIYSAKRQYENAVIVLDDLIATGPADKKATYTVDAIKNQSIIAKWPMTPDMKNPQTAQNPGREKLLGYYLSLNTQLAKIHWNIIGQIGLLYINLGKTQTAYDLWQETLPKVSDTEEARYAAAQMLVAYHQSKLWQRLETLSDLCIQHKVMPQGFKVLSLATYLSDALYFGGKEFYGNKQYRFAWQKFARFIDVFTKDARRDEVMYLVAFAYRADQKFVEAVKSLVDHTTQYRSSPYRNHALQVGGGWSIDMALEAQIVYFYQTFLNEYPTHKDAQHIRDTMIRTYLAFGHFGDAARLLKFQVADSSLDVNKRVKAALSQMDIEEKYGSRNEGEWGASQALALSQHPDVIAAVAAFRARRIVHEGDQVAAKITALLGQVNNLDMTSRYVQEVVGQIRYYYAETKALTESEEIFNLDIEDHYAVLDAQVAKFSTARRYFDDVCAVGQTSFCAPALQRISQMTAIASATIDTIQIQKSLEKETVQRFEERKKTVLGQLAHLGKSTSAGAYELASHGMTAPGLSYDIIWQKTNDWNFGQSEGDAGHAYTQWTTKQ